MTDIHRTRAKEEMDITDWFTALLILAAASFVSSQWSQTWDNSLGWNLMLFGILVLAEVAVYKAILTLVYLFSHDEKNQ